MKRFSITILSLLVLCLVFTSCPNLTSNNDNSGQNGQPSIGYNTGDIAPDFQLSDTESNTVSLSSYRGSPVMINFWYLNCGYCIAEMPYIQQINEEYQSQGLIILTVNITDSTAKITDFLQSSNYTFTVILDSGRATASAYNVKGYPTTLFIDKDGIIRDRKLGAFRNKAEIENNLNKIMS